MTPGVAFFTPVHPFRVKNACARTHTTPICCLGTTEQDLVQWSLAQNISFPQLHIRQHDHHRSLFASTNIHPHSPLITIPHQAALMIDMNDHTLPAFHTLTLTKQYWQSAEWYIRLAILLLDEKRRPNSTFAPYIAALPEQPWSALWASQVLPRHVWQKQMHPLAMTTMIDSFRKHVKSCFVPLKDMFTLQEFVWAICIVQSRSFGAPVKGGGQVVKFALFPILDMMNHDVRVRSKLEWQHENGVFQVTTKEAWQEGEEVFVSYGAKSGEELLMFYGFVAGGNEAHFVSMGQVNGESVFRFLPDGLDEKLVRELRQVVGGEGLERELKVWKIIEDKCQSMLKRLGQFSEQDIEKLEHLVQKSGVIWDWQKDGGDAALLFRYEQWRVLTATVERVRHYAKISKAVGRVCTVLMPPSQSVLKTKVWQDGSLGLQQYAIPAED